jgi:hypothetical protein
MDVLSYDPGPLPTAPSPRAGEMVEITVEGWPPWKDVSASIRNRSNHQYTTFARLRDAAIAAMNGRAWYVGPISLDITIRCPEDQSRRGLVDYLGGIMDTLGGCHGYSFTYLPVVSEDDAQVCSGKSQFIADDAVSYDVRIRFLDESA